MARIVIDSDGNKRYFNFIGQLHRENGPAYISIYGYMSWSQNDRLHSFTDPAIWRVNGERRWCTHGVYLRDGGPRLDCPNGHKRWKNAQGVQWPELK